MAVRHVSSVSSLMVKKPGSKQAVAVRHISSASSLTGTQRRIRRIMESSSDPYSADGLSMRPYHDLLEAFCQHHWISTDMNGTKHDNGFPELIDYAITHHYPTLEFLSTTGCSTFVEDMIWKYEHVILRTIKNIETHDFWHQHCNDLLILNREHHKCRGKVQTNAQVNFEAGKRAPIGNYYRCKWTSSYFCWMLPPAHDPLQCPPFIQRQQV